MPSKTIVVLQNETKEEHSGWVAALNKIGLYDYIIVDISKSDWLLQIVKLNIHFCLARPSGAVSYFKEMYDERLHTIANELRIRIYPTIDECRIYENKRALSYLLKALKIKHPETYIHYNISEALSFLEQVTYPIVAKTAIGAGGSGVKILKSKREALSYVQQAFNSGITRSWAPNLRKGNFKERIIKRVSNLPETIRWFKQKKSRATVDPQKGYVLFQKYIPCDHEWRCVVVGDSYFGHKKLRTRGEMMSGTSAVSWDLPPERLLNFVEDVMRKTGFYSQAVDVFESKEGEYYVNELQAFWGSKNPHQMLKDGKPGRYVRKQNDWVFEEGEFNSNNSYDLRLQHAIKLYNQQKL